MNLRIEEADARAAEPSEVGSRAASKALLPASFLQLLRWLSQQDEKTHA